MRISICPHIGKPVITVKCALASQCENTKCDLAETEIKKEKEN